MGSFASSLHVKSSDASRVATHLTDILVEEGWQPTEKRADQRSAGSGPATLRGLHISAARDGWVSILDSDLAGAHSLAPALAQSLDTHAIFFFVNDSDGWSYLLADPSGVVTEFDSDEGARDDDEYGDDGDLIEAGAAIGQIRALMQDGSVLQQFQQIQSQMSAAAPPEIKAAEARIKSGKGTAADMQQYQAWATQQMPNYMAEMRQMLAGALGPFKAMSAAGGKQRKKRRSSKAERKAAQERLERLRPLFADGVTDEAVEAVFDKRSTFAEDVLAEFLPLVGIADYYANLGYQYLDETRPAELAAHNIQFIHHLRFETNQRSLRVFS